MTRAMLMAGRFNHGPRGILLDIAYTRLFTLGSFSRALLALNGDPIGLSRKFASVAE